MKVLSAEFVLSAKEPVHYPPAVLPEIAFAGRSNVGKSSLINTLLKRKGLARTSNTPGRTQEINFFSVNNWLAFIDLPGYGYAKVPEGIRKHWGPMIETYLSERETLRLVVLILDIRRDPAEEDRQLIGWLAFYRLPFLIVLTKIDKVSRNELGRRQSRIGEDLGLSPATPLISFSAKTGVGRDLLWREIEKVLASDPGTDPEIHTPGRSRKKRTS
ncbi:MAG: YihA family ribosome biogenesis GTP-binding protein [Syntrophus sp. (in: bacteria)]|nr:YihA family ribosome biogenesis GTP-binding protein [Syntrophus sp. (in: bacteria)]